MVNRKLLATALLVGFYFLPAQSFADPRFYTEVHPNYGTLDDAYIFSVVLDKFDEDTGAPLLTGGNDFTLSLIGPQTSVTVVNGAVSRQIIYNYQLIPKRAGTLNSPGAEITVDGKNFTAPPVSIKVDGTRTDSSANDGGNKDYFMRQSINAGEHVYAGQQLALTLQIFTHVNLNDPQLSDFTFANFENQPLGEQENTRRLLQGVPYTVSTLRRALFPIAAGSFEIPARELKAKVRVQTRGASGSFPFGAVDPFDPDFMDQFFGQGRLKDVTIKSNTLQLRVEPLPPPPAPLPLLGLDAAPVGDTFVTVTYDPSTIKFGETKSVLLTVSSVGSIQALKSSGLQGNDALRIYEESPETKTAMKGDKLLTTKTIKLSLVPLSGGSVKIPPIELAFFDPNLQKYAAAQSQAIEFSVTGSPAPAPQAAASSQSQPQLAQTPPVSSSATPLYEEKSAFEKLSEQISPATAILVCAAFAGVILACALGFLVRRRYAPKYALAAEVKRAKTAEALLAALRGHLLQKYPSLPPHFSRENLRAVISDRDLLYRIESVLDRCDAAIFGGKSTGLEELRDTITAIIEAA